MYNTLKVYDSIWESGNTIEKRRILGDSLNAIRLEVDDQTLNIFTDSCFRENPLDIINTHLYARYLFDLVKEEVSSFLMR